MFNIYFSQEAEHKFAMSETAEITSFITELSPNVDVIWGATIDDTLGEKIKITILAAGFDVELSKDNGSIDFVPREIPVTQSTATQKTPEAIEVMYGKEKVDELNKQKYIILNEAAMDDDSILEMLESAPTYNRDKVVAEGLRSRIKALAEGKSVETPVAANASSSQGQVVNFC